VGGRPLVTIEFWVSYPITFVFLPSSMSCAVVTSEMRLLQNYFRIISAFVDVRLK